MTTSPPLRVLVIDDDPRIREVFSWAIAEMGHDVDVAASGRGGLGLVERRHYDVVVTDLVMPDLDGWGVVRSVQATHPDIALIVVSGSLAPPDSGRTRTDGVVLLAKPVDFEVLEAAIEQAGHPIAARA